MFTFVIGSPKTHVNAGCEQRQSRSLMRKRSERKTAFPGCHAAGLDELPGGDNELKLIYCSSQHTDTHTHTHTHTYTHSDRHTHTHIAGSLMELNTQVLMLQGWASERGCRQIKRWSRNSTAQLRLKRAAMLLGVCVCIWPGPSASAGRFP